MRASRSVCARFALDGHLARNRRTRASSDQGQLGFVLARAGFGERYPHRYG